MNKVYLMKMLFKKMYISSYISFLQFDVNFLFFYLESFARLDERLDALEKKVREKVAAQGFPDSYIETEFFLHLRYQGTDCALMCTPSKNSENNATKHGDFLTTFLER